MATPHFNYRPPAGSVIDLDEREARWTGTAWIRRGTTYTVPSGHHLVGTPGGPLAGWTYDWYQRAWMEPGPPQQPGGAAMPRFASRAAAPVSAVHAPVSAAPAPAPAAPAPQPQTQAPAVAPENVEVSVKPQTVIEDLMKHPVAPAVGAGLLVISYITDEPEPPVIPPELPEATAKFWQMTYAQNQQRFERRMGMYRDLGMLLLGYSGTRSIVDVLGHRHLHGTAADNRPEILIEKRAA